jgi:transcriptional regulator with XRE-family HTH domain
MAQENAPDPDEPGSGTIMVNGDLLDLLCRAAGMTQKDLAGRTGLSRGYISRVRRGESGVMPRTYGRILDAFGDPSRDIRVHWNELLAGSDGQ